MTAIVGILCKDGAVVGTDSSTTFVDSARNRTIEQPSEKLTIVRDQVIVAGAGQVGLGQRFCSVVEVAYAKNEFQTHPIELVKNLSRKAIEDFGQTYLQLGQFEYGSMVAFAHANKPFLCEFQAGTFQPEMKTEGLWYGSLGSAQGITDPFLGFIRDIFWEAGPPTLPEGIFAATWTLQQAISLNTGGVNGPIRVAVLESDGKGHLKARKLTGDELGEHQQYVEEAKRYLREFRGKFCAPPTTEVPKR